MRFSFGLRLVPLLCPIFLSSSFPLLVLCRFSLVRLLLRIGRCCNCYLTRHNFRVSLAVPSNYLVVVSRAVAGLRFVTSGRKVPPRFFWLPVERLTNLPHVSRPLATSRWLPLKKPELSSTPPLQLLFALRCVSRRIANTRSSADSSPSFWVSAPTSRLPSPSRRQIRPLCAHRVTSFLAELTPVLSNATRYILSPTADCAPPRPTDYSS